VDVTSIEGLLVALLVVIPGAAGDGLMRRVLNKPRPKTGFSEVLRAILWSGAALVIVEIAARLLRGGTEFGDFLLNRTSAVSEAEAAVDLTGAYVVYFAVALCLPILGTLIVDRATRSFTDRTPDAIAFDELFERFAPRTVEGYVFAVADLGDDEVDGWFLWRSTGDVADRALLLRDFESESVTLVPFESMRTLTLIDPNPEEPT